jgi:hypothetical protein
MRFFFLLWVLGAAAFGHAQQPTSVTLTQGTLSFDVSGITFHTKDKDYRYPLSPPGPSTPGALTLQAPGLTTHKFEHREVAPAGGGAAKNISRLTLTTTDGAFIELIAGQLTEVYHIEITHADQSQLVLWKSAAELQ